MTHQPIGILGLGYLGRELARRFDWPVTSWGTVRAARPEDPASIDGVKCIVWDWAQRDTWVNLPESADTLVLTVPPIYDELDTERTRLRDWCGWMKTHRPALRRLIYISSTSVYPNKDGLWTEDASLTLEESSTSSGQLRLMSERTLSAFFELQVVRPGGIYGPGRNLAERVVAGRALPNSGRPTHRIHVADLAGIVHSLVHEHRSVSCVNAIDCEPETSANVVKWLSGQAFFSAYADRVLQTLDTIKKEAPNGSSSASMRRIDQHRLVDELGYRLMFPTYREGLSGAWQETDHGAVHSSE